MTQPARYDTDCNLIDPQAQRIQSLTWRGKPLQKDAQFRVAVNNYRAFTGKFAGTGEKNVVLSAPDEVRTIVANYLAEQTKQKGEYTPKVNNTWRIAPIVSETPLDVRIETSPAQRAADYIKQHAQHPMSRLEKDEIGFAVYRIDLQKK